MITRLRDPPRPPFPSRARHPYYSPIHTHFFARSTSRTTDLSEPPLSSTNSPFLLAHTSTNPRTAITTSPSPPQTPRSWIKLQFTLPSRAAYMNFCFPPSSRLNAPREALKLRASPSLSSRIPVQTCGALYLTFILGVVRPTRRLFDMLLGWFSPPGMAGVLWQQPVLSSRKCHSGCKRQSYHSHAITKGLSPTPSYHYGALLPLGLESARLLSLCRRRAGAKPLSNDQCSFNPLSGR
ncbi:hypothetical protein GOBAR_AA23973 [Gossypium barbadense]|uniref:Uncharacterized protein n=1 Tax=Gossypium barbadense TaxID=3634 RepID=A0A2P5X066_GOSBA|nr:hypothetical protein GOBAR_AA23973 [Gossypium barbadense]